MIGRSSEKACLCACVNLSSLSSARPETRHTHTHLPPTHTHTAADLAGYAQRYKRAAHFAAILPIFVCVRILVNTHKCRKLIYYTVVVRVSVRLQESSSVS